jgi:hypothetical protein
MTADRFTMAVREYLAVCAEYGQVLDPKYHPTARGAVKLIFHRSTEEADMIEAAFAAMTRQKTKRRKTQGNDDGEQAEQGNGASRVHAA